VSQPKKKRPDPAKKRAPRSSVAGKLTPAVLAAILAMIAEGNTVGKACEAQMVSRQALYLHRKKPKNKAYDDEVRAALRGRLEIVTDALFERAVGGNVTAMIFYLCNRSRHLKANDPDKWVNVNRTEISGPDGEIFQGLFFAPELVENPEEWEKHARRTMDKIQERRDKETG